MKLRRWFLKSKKKKQYMPYTGMTVCGCVYIDGYLIEECGFHTGRMP